MKSLLIKIFSVSVVLVVIVSAWRYFNPAPVQAIKPKVITVKSEYAIFSSDPLLSKMLIQGFVGRAKKLTDEDEKKLNFEISKLKKPTDVLEFMGRVAQIDHIVIDGGSLAYRADLYQKLRDSKKLGRFIKFSDSKDPLVSVSKGLLQYVSKQKVSPKIESIALYGYLEEVYGLTNFSEFKRETFRKQLDKGHLSAEEIRPLMFIGMIDPNLLYQNQNKFKLENHFDRLDQSKDMDLVVLWKYLSEPN